MISDFISVNATGVTVAATVASAVTALPVMAAGAAPLNVAKYIRLQATGFICVRLGGSGAVATTNDLLLSQNEGVILASAGNSHFAYITLSGNANLNVVALEA